MVRFTEIIDASIEWTTAVLFRPFRPKKWLILGFAALLAGYLAGGCNANFFNYYGKEKDKRAETKTVSQTLPGSAQQEIKQQSKVNALNEARFLLKNPLFIALILVIVILTILVTIGLIVLMMWLRARFAFIFLEDVIKNDASLKLPFKANKKIGNSLFLFSLAFAAVFLSLFGLLIFKCIWDLVKLGAFNKTAVVGLKKIFLACLPYGLSFFLLIFIAGIIHLVMGDFVLVVMFRDKIKIMRAWRRTLAILSVHKTDFLKYIFVKIGLGFCSGSLYGLLSIVSFIGFLLPIGIVTAVFYFIYLLIPTALHFLYFVILFIIAIPVIFFLMYCQMCLGLPFAIFFRTLSLKFIGQLDQRYNLFRYIPDKEAGL